MRVRLLGLVLVLLLPFEATARPGWTTGTFVYANLCTQAESGGIEGLRIVVRRSPNGDGVTYEAASGRLPPPMSAETLAFDEATQELSFTIAGETGPLTFRGMADNTVLAGTLTDRDGEHLLRLRRVLRSQADKACQAVPHDTETTASAR